MAGTILLGIPLTLLLLALLARRRARRLVAGATHPGLQRLDATLQRSRWTGLAVGVLAVGVLALLDLGRGIMTAPAVLALAVALALVVGQARSWRDAQTLGTASLEQRSAARYLPRALLAVGALLLAGLLVLLAWCARHQDDTGTQWFWQSADGLHTASGSPFPGTHYSVPVVVVLGLLVLTCLAGTVMTVRRPRNGADPVVVAVDDDARRRSAASLAGCLVAGVSATAALCLLTATNGLASLAGRSPDLVNGAVDGRVETMALLGGLVCLTVAAWAASVVLVPGSPRPVAQQAAASPLGVSVR